MECLTPTVSFDTFIDNYFTSFRLLNHFKISNIRATGVLNKSKLRKCTIIRDEQLQKKEMYIFSEHWPAHIKQKSNVTVTVVG